MTVGGVLTHPHQQVYVSKWVTFGACALLQVRPCSTPCSM